MTDIFDFISNNGFAIVVAIYMMIYNNKSLTSLTKAINKQTTMLETVLGVKDSGEDKKGVIDYE